MKPIKQYIEALFSSDPKVSFMRVLSFFMFIEASIFLFTKVQIETLNWQGVAVIALLYGLAFFPKVIQKKYEQLNILNNQLAKLKEEKEENSKPTVQEP